MKLSEKLARLKARRGLTTDALAQKSGIPKGTINKVLNGETRNPTIGTLRKIAEAAKCPLAEFFADELAEAGLEIVKKADAPHPPLGQYGRLPKQEPLPSEGRGMAGAQGSGDDGIANADIQGSRITNPSEPGFGQQASESLRPAGSIICPSCGEIIKLGVLR